MTLSIAVFAVAVALSAETAGGARGVVVEAAPAPEADPRAGTVWTREVDWAATGAETAAVLSGLLRTDTTNPDGHETRAAVYLGAWLAREGVASEIVEFAPGRGSLIARLPADDALRDGPPLCLLSHLDVAEAEADRWPAEAGPLSGAIDSEGQVWGRGALDMKGLTAMQAMVLATAARRGVPLRRDLVLVAVADEEVSNLGMRHVADEDWDRVGCSHAINEGGIGITDLFFEGQDVYSISVGEKGALWGKVVATGEPGHGSVPLPDQSIDRLVDAILAVEARPVRPAYHPSLTALLAAIGVHQGGVAGGILQRPALTRTLLRGTFLGNPITRAVVLDTANITGLGGAMLPNVVPGEAWANLDARLLPGSDPDAFVASLLDAIDDPAVRIDVDSYIPSNVSDWQGDPLFEALAERAVEGHPERVAGPVLSVGYTDSAVLRDLGVRAYGFMPVLVDPEQLAGMHGDNERVSIDQLTDGVRILTTAVLDFAAHPTAAAGATLAATPWPASAWPPPEWAAHTPVSPLVPLPPRYSGPGGGPSELGASGPTSTAALPAPPGAAPPAEGSPGSVSLPPIKPALPTVGPTTPTPTPTPPPPPPWGT